MRPLLLTVKDYFEYFPLYEAGTGGGVETEFMSNEQYFWVQTFVPKEFFNLYDSRLILDVPLTLLREQIPNRVQIKFELIGIGCLDDAEAYIFKAWGVNIKDSVTIQSKK